jgi:hypothetical protein
MLVNARVLIALIAGAWLLAPPIHSATLTSTAEQASRSKGIRSNTLGPRILRRQSPIEFVDDVPVSEKESLLPPPLVTFRSPVELRAQYPPNPDAETVAQAFRQTFGDLIDFSFSLSGSDEDLLVRQATTEALMSVAGRVYFLDRVLLSRDILPKYFDKNGDRFVRRVSVTGRRLVAGKPSFNLELIIDQDALLNDLEEKRFIFRPKLRPFVYVFLDQTVDGAPDTAEQRGRKAMEDVIRDRDLRYADHGAPSMETPDMDISASPEAFLIGRQAAQRNEIEVALAGKMVTRPVDLERSLSDEDWANNTLAVSVMADPLTAPVTANIPLVDLAAGLNGVLDARRESGEREWWDVGSIEVDVPVESMELTGEMKSQLEGRATLPKALIPVTRLGLRRNYYRPFYNIATRLDLKLVRIDNSEILAEVSVETVASNDDRERAVQQSISKAVNIAANELIDDFNEVWNKTVLDDADLKILVSRVSEADLESLVSFIGELDADAKVYVRSLVGNVAVLTVDFPGGGDQLVKAITRFEHPRFRLVTAKRDRLEIEQI